jgi:protein ImuB
LRARLGDEAVYRLHDTVDPRPERAQAAAGEGPEAVEVCRRPTWLLERPIPLRGTPPRILAGPERLETGWWDGGEVCRDYYAVETSQGQCAWAFCAPGEQSGWMIHGWFA